MRYLCLIYENEKSWATMPKDQTDQVMAEYGTFTQGIKESGHYLGGNALEVTYDRGTTEGGSSGAALFSAAGRVIGQLGGGPAGSCSTGITVKRKARAARVSARRPSLDVLTF